MRGLVIALALLSSASGFWQWLWGLWRGTLDADILRRFKDTWGWFAEDMNPHWDRVAEDGRLFHDLKNLTTEWVRRDAQFASKALAWGLISGWAMFMIVAIVATIFATFT